MKSKRSWHDGLPITDPFELPKDIARKLDECAKIKDAKPDEQLSALKYLWIHVCPEADGSSPNGPAASEQELTVEDWLNIVDEAASLGVEWLFVCIRDALGKHPCIWDICEWAQNAHKLKLGLHLCGPPLDANDYQYLSALDKSVTYLFVSKEISESALPLERQGFRLLPAEVTPEDHTPPCELAQSMVCVNPKGKLYTCGLVLGHSQYMLGNILERPLADVLNNESAAKRQILEGVPHTKSDCHCCPPLMERRTRR